MSRIFPYYECVIFSSKYKRSIFKDKKKKGYTEKIMDLNI